MGLLDDAIRQHLELKRVRGADPGEVIRQEREALGAHPRQETIAPDVEGRDEAHSDDPPPQSAPADEAYHPTDTSVRGANTEPPALTAHEHRPAARDRRAHGALDQETAEVDVVAMLGGETDEEPSAATPSTKNEP